MKYFGGLKKKHSCLKVKHQSEANVFNRHFKASFDVTLGFYYISCGYLKLNAMVNGENNLLKTFYKKDRLK